MRRAADSGERINRGPLANAQLAIGLGLRVSNAGYFAGATSLTGVPSDLVFSPGLLAAFKSRSISPARRACQRQGREHDRALRTHDLLANDMTIWALDVAAAGDVIPEGLSLLHLTHQEKSTLPG